MKKLYLLLFFFLSFHIFAQTWERDMSFNPFTLPADHNYGARGSAKSVIQPDGKIVLVSTYFHNIYYSSVKRISATNKTDNAFKSDNVFNGEIKDIALQPDGKIVLVGKFTTVNGLPSKYIVRLNSDGTVDTTFDVGTGFSAYTHSNYPYAGAVAVRPDGKILVGGDLGRYKNTYKKSLFLLNNDGTLDESFTMASSLGEFTITNILLLRDGNILIANGRHVAIFKLNPDGSKHLTDFTTRPDFTITSGFPVIDLKLGCMVEDNNGKILVGGLFDRVNNISYKNFVRLNANGTVDTTNPATGFGGPYTSSNLQQGVTSILPLSDGKLLVGGSFGRFANEPANGLVKLNPDLTKDTSFTGGIDNDSSNLPRIYSTAYLLLQHPDGDIVCSGAFANYNNVSCSGLVKFNADGVRNNTFNNICRGFDRAVTKLELQPDGKILAIGQFHAYNGENRNRILRLNADGTVDTGFNVATEAFMLDHEAPRDIKVQADGKILVASDGRYFNLNSWKGGGLVRLNTDGSLEEAFNPLPHVTATDRRVWGQCMTIAVQPDGKIIAGGSFYYGSSPIMHLARLHPDGTLDTSFQFTSPFTWISKIILLPDGRILAMGKVSSSSSNHVRILCILSNGAIDTTFNLPATIDYPNNNSLFMELQQDGKILVTLDSHNKHAIARINPDGSLDPGFSFSTINTRFNTDYCATGIMPDGKIVIATPLSVSPTCLLALNSNGSVDSTFNVGTGFAHSGSDTDRISSIKVQQDGKILLAGGFGSFNGTENRAIVRLTTAALGSQDFTGNTTMTLYPNPVKGRLFINSTDNLKDFTIYNLSGQEIKQGKIYSGGIDVSLLSAGIYIINFTGDTATYKTRFVKE